MQQMVSLVKVAINKKIEYCNNKKNYLKIDVNYLNIRKYYHKYFYYTLTLLPYNIIF